MEEIDPKDLAFFKTMLTEQLEDLLYRAEQTVGDLVRPGDVEADPLDQAALESERNYTLRIRDRESRLIKKIKAALLKIDDGSFGICESCGDEITVARLRARPVTAYCIQCKTRMEATERAVGF
jgi:RNA polymerase-binding transcription factor